jgi:N6-adenosine-specific RNA methylase IME4
MNTALIGDAFTARGIGGIRMQGNKKYQIILADPPWPQAKGGKKSVRPKSSGEELDYPILSLVEISDILREAKKMGSPDHNFFIWAIDRYLHEAETMMRLMGYKLHARMIWNKVTGIPAAFTIRFGHEYLLWFYKEKLLPVAKEERGKIHSVFTEQVTRHSQKPVIAYEIIERLYPDTNRLELFARNHRGNWDCWGNEIESDIQLGA